MAMTTATDDNDNEVNGNGATGDKVVDVGDGATRDNGDDDDEGDDDDDGDGATKG